MKKFFSIINPYNYRYLLGYLFIALLMVSIIMIASLHVTNGLTPDETASLAVTNDLINHQTVVDLPLHLLRKFCLELFGVSILAIKLPSIILAVIAVIVIFLLLKRWFTLNIVVLAELAMMATGQFIYIAQEATANILYVLLTALILLFASVVFRGNKHNIGAKIGLLGAMAISCFSPYFIYINLGLILGALAHPHTRYILLNRKYHKEWLMAMILPLSMVGYWVFLSVNNSDFWQSLLGYPFGQIDILENAKLIFRSYIWTNPFVIEGRGQILPMIDFSTIIVIMIGFFVSLKNHHSPRTYLIIAWLLFAIPLLLIRPQLIAIITIPLFMLFAIGLDMILRQWYKLFPLNPYARTGGLMVLVGLIGVMIFSSVDRFVFGYQYMEEAARYQNTDLTIINRVASKIDKMIIVVSDQEQPIYQALAHFNPQKFIIKQAQGNIDFDDNRQLVVTHATKNSEAASKWQLRQIVTNDRKNTDEADRFYIYQKPPPQK